MILITGASGAIGQSLLKKYPEAIGVYKNTKIKNGWYCDICRKDSVKDLIDRVNPNTIIHCSAISSPKHPEDYENFINQHILTTTNLLECCKNNTKFIFISSYLVFENFPEINPVSIYGAMKISCKHICNVYAKMKNLNLTIIRPCSVVLKDSTHGLIHDLIKKLKSDSEELEIWGSSPGSSRSYCNIDDLIDCIDKNIDNGSRVINFFPHDSLTVENVAKIIMNKLNIYKPIRWTNNSYSGDFNNLDTSKIAIYQNLEVKTNSVGAIERMFNETPSLD